MNLQESQKLTEIQRAVAEIHRAVVGHAPPAQMLGNESELLPCPFCGGGATVIGPDAQMHVYVRCEACAARATVFYANHGGTTAEAIAAWNRRAPDGGEAVAWTDNANINKLHESGVIGNMWPRRDLDSDVPLYLRPALNSGSGTWRPIETVPRDGVFGLLVASTGYHEKEYPTTKYHAVQSYWHEGHLAHVNAGEKPVGWCPMPPVNWPALPASPATPVSEER